MFCIAEDPNDLRVGQIVEKIRNLNFSPKNLTTFVHRFGEAR